MTMVVHLRPGCDGRPARFFSKFTIESSHIPHMFGPVGEPHPARMKAAQAGRRRW